MVGMQLLTGRHSELVAIWQQTLMTPSTWRYGRAYGSHGIIDSRLHFIQNQLQRDAKSLETRTMRHLESITQLV
jgi:hypothetical protein